MLAGPPPPFPIVFGLPSHRITPPSSTPQAGTIGIPFSLSRKRGGERRLRSTVTTRGSRAHTIPGPREREQRAGPGQRRGPPTTSNGREPSPYFSPWPGQRPRVIRAFSPFSGPWRRPPTSHPPSRPSMLLPDTLEPRHARRRVAGHDRPGLPRHPRSRDTRPGPVGAAEILDNFGSFASSGGTGSTSATSTSGASRRTRRPPPRASPGRRRRGSRTTPGGSARSSTPRRSWTTRSSPRCSSRSSASRWSAIGLSRPRREARAAERLAAAHPPRGRRRATPPRAEPARRRAATPDRGLDRCPEPRRRACGRPGARRARWCGRSSKGPSPTCASSRAGSTRRCSRVRVSRRPYARARSAPRRRSSSTSICRGACRSRSRRPRTTSARRLSRTPCVTRRPGMSGSRSRTTARVS